MIRGQGEDSCGKSASDEEAHRPPVESEALHGNQLRCQAICVSSCIPFVRI
ncbi:hypothetical protein ACFX41_01865 [Priestia sp. YIM B13546]|uniref:hypothetical protein n=1 Tax=Priestia sp. YIM B13546 TaxID=3366302 RepID=UPI0036723515